MGNSSTRERIITRGIGFGIFLLITTYLLAFVLFGRLTGFTLVLFLGEIVFVAGLLIIFFQRGYPGRVLAVPIAAGILLSMVAVMIVIVIGTTLIHAPLPPPDSPAWKSGNRVIAMAVSTDEISTTSPEARELLISGLRIASWNNQFAEAITYYDQALAIDPNLTEAWMAKGVAHHNLGSYAESVGCLDSALALDPGNAAAWSLKGTILESWRRPDEAAACYAKAGELDSRYQPPPPMTAIPTSPPAIITPNDTNVRTPGSYPPHHPPTLFIFSLKDAIDIAGEPVFIPLSLPPGYAFGGGSADLDGAVSLWISNGTDSIRYIQASPPFPVPGVLEGPSTKIVSGEFQGWCSEMDGQYQLAWSNNTHKYFLIGNISCDDYLPMAQSLGRLTTISLDLVPWEEPVPATPLPPSEIMNLVFSLDWLNEHDTDPDPRIFNITMTPEEFTSSFSPDQENSLLSRHREVEDGQRIALLTMPKTMFAWFNNDPSRVRVHFPDTFFRFYDSMDALSEDLQAR